MEVDLEAAVGKPASDVGHGAERGAEFAGDLGIGLADISPQQDQDPVALPAGERPGLPLLQGRPPVSRA